MENIMFSKLQFLNAIQSKYIYQQKMVYSIDEEGRENLIENFAEIMKYPMRSVKIERMEDYNRDIFDYCLYLKRKQKHKKPITCHLFYASKGAYSFKEHTDPDDVIIYCCEGEKSLTINGSYIKIPSLSWVKIPANTPHQAFNETEALTLSFGLEDFIEDKVTYELDGLSKND